MLNNSAKDWETYDLMRAEINDPVEKLENEYKKYRKFYDPVMFQKKLEDKKMIWQVCKDKCDEMLGTTKRCYGTIIVLAGDEKKDFLDKEVAEVEEKMLIVGKCEKKLAALTEYCEKLTDAVNRCKALSEWATPSKAHLDDICTSTTMIPEDRVKEIIVLQEEANERRPLLDPLDADFKALITDEDLEKSETAKVTLQEWTDTKQFSTEVIDEIEKEATSISVDDRLYADYYSLVKEFTPWIGEAETKTKETSRSPKLLKIVLHLSRLVSNLTPTAWRAAASWTRQPRHALTWRSRATPRTKSKP